MVSIEELKLGNETLEALKFLLSQITELETAISQIDISEIKDANTLTKEQIATLQDVKNAVESINIELSSKKSDFDEKKQNFDTNMNAFRNDKADFDEKKADFDSKNNTALSNFAFIANNIEKINSVSALLAEAKAILEVIKPIEQRTQAALNTIANSQAKFDELDALKATLLELKRSLENISTTGLINDNSASTTATYSSTKINNLLVEKLDASEKNKYVSLENGKIKAEMLPDINATRLGGKEAGEFSLKSENEEKMRELDNKVWEAENSLSDKMLVLETKVDTKLDKSLVGVANGVAKLDSKAKILSEYIPDEYMSINKAREEITENITIQNVSLMEDIGRTYIRKDSIAHVLGGSDSLVMSQKGVSEALNSKQGGVIMLENEASPITTTAIGAQFYCKSNSGIYVLINNSELTKESKLSEAANKGKIVKIDKGFTELSWLKNSNPSSVKAFFGYANIYSSNTSITFPSSFSSHYTAIIQASPYYTDKKAGRTSRVLSYAPDINTSTSYNNFSSLAGAYESNISIQCSLSGFKFSLSNDADMKLTYFVFGF